MILSATRDEIEILRTALSEYRNALSSRAKVFCTGHSETGIELCIQRLNVEVLLQSLEEPPTRRETRMRIASPGPRRPEETAITARAA